MGDQEKFESFKQQLVEDNEKRYGREARAQYGDEAVDSSIRKVQGMSKAQFDQFNSLSAELMATLSAAFKIGDPAGELAQKAADLHRQWLSYFWDNYSSEAHRGVAQMYVDDERFTAYYDSIQPGTAAFLRNVINIYTSQHSG